MAKATIIQWLDENQAPFIEIEKDIWNYPELAMDEVFASTRQKEFLESQGFKIYEIEGVKTAFCAEYGTEKPIVAILGEYDALPEMSQTISTKRTPIEGQKCGHACGHNIIGTAGVAAAAAVKQMIKSGEIKGTVRYYGCPAEEKDNGKVRMVEAGCFKDMDCSIIWHPQDFTGVSYQQYYSAWHNMDFVFKGETGQSNAAKKYGGSALQAAELMTTGMQYMREYIWDFYRMHYAVINDCQRANLIPETVRINCTIRSMKKAGLKKLRDRIIEIAEGAALMSKTEMTYSLHDELYEDLENTVMVDTIKKNMEEIGMYQLTEEEKEFTSKLAETMFPGAREKTAAYYDIPDEEICAGMHTGLVNKDKLFYLPSDDAGLLSWMAPFGTFLVSMVPVGMPMHCWQATALAGSTVGEKTMMYAAKVMATTVYDLMSDENLLLRVKEEFAKKINK